MQNLSYGWAKRFAETAPERQLKEQFKHIRNRRFVRYFTVAVHDWGVMDAQGRKGCTGKA